MVDATSPIAYGYTDNLAIWSDNGPIFNVSNITAGAAGGGLGGDDATRPTGRGTADDPDMPQGRPGVETAGGAESRGVAGDASHGRTAAQRHQRHPAVGAAARRAAVRRHARPARLGPASRTAAEIAQHPAVIDVPLDKGHVVVFSNNPIWRGETARQLFPGLQRAAAPRSAQRGEKTRREIRAVRK